MFKRILIPALLIASPALSLSCLPYGPGDAFREAAASEDSYVVVLGTLEFDESKLPKVDWDHQEQTPEHTIFGATLTGHQLSSTGFDTDFAQSIQVDVQCLGPWCGGLTSGIDYVAFLKQTDAGLLLETNPCGGFDFGAPSQEVIDQVISCVQGKDCPSAQP